MSVAIGFYPALINELHREHRALINCLSEVKNSARIRDKKAFFLNLQQFKSLLVAHLLKEAIKLYIYLRQQLKADHEAYQLISHYKKEMDGISRDAISIIDRLSASDSKEMDFHEIFKRIDELDLVLSERIHREEVELYPLYHERYQNST